MIIKSSEPTAAGAVRLASAVRPNRKPNRTSAFLLWAPESGLSSIGHDQTFR
jgi:hypothetical protein